MLQIVIFWFLVLYIAHFDDNQSAVNKLHNFQNYVEQYWQVLNNNHKMINFYFKISGKFDNWKNQMIKIVVSYHWIGKIVCLTFFYPYKKPQTPTDIWGLLS